MSTQRTRGNSLDPFLRPGTTLSTSRALSVAQQKENQGKEEEIFRGMSPAASSATVRLIVTALEANAGAPVFALSTGAFVRGFLEGGAGQ